MSGKIIYFPTHQRVKKLNTKSSLRVPDVIEHPNFVRPAPVNHDRYTILYYALIAMPLLAALPLMINYYLKLKH